MSPARETPIPLGFWNHSVVVQPNNFVYKSLSNWAVNIAVGCGHACRFCYVPSASTNKLKPQLSKLGVADPDADWGDYVFLRHWDEEAFRKSVLRAEATPRSELKKDGNRAVIFCSTTDPYQVFRHPDPEQRKKLDEAAELIMRRSLEIIRDESSLNVRILTRSPLARIHFPLFKSFGHRLLFGMSLPTLNNALAKVYEPKAPAPSARLATLKAAKDFGIPVYVAMAPTYPECDPADLRATLTAVRDLDPYTIFHEPINIRSENVARIAAKGKEVGIELRTEVFSSSDIWARYALEALESVEGIAAELGLAGRLHLWPDRNLGSARALSLHAAKDRPAKLRWLKKYWHRISEWPQPTHEDVQIESKLRQLVAAASAGKAWTDREIENLTYEDALQLFQTGEYEDLPSWAKFVVDGVLAEFYVNFHEPTRPVLLGQRLPPRVAEIVSRINAAEEPRPPASGDRDQLRREAFQVWSQIKHMKSPSAHRLSAPILKKYGISRAALGAIFAHFTMGRVPG